MSAQLLELNPNSWQLQGAVEFNSAASLAQQLNWPKTAASSQNSATDFNNSLSLNLSQAAGNSALVLVLLAWHRRSLELGFKLEFTQPNAKLLNLVRLSGLQEILVFS